MIDAQVLPRIRPAAKVTFWHLLALCFGSAIVGEIICKIIFAQAKPSPFIEDSLMFLVGDLIGLALYHLMAKKRGWPSLANWFFFRRKMILAYCFLAPLAGIACVFGLASLILWLFGDFPDVSQEELIPSSVAQLPLAVLTIVIVGPAMEELLFRGVFFVWLRARTSLWTSILLTSLIFALLHDNHYSTGLFAIFFFAQRFGLGVATSLLAQRFRSLAPSYALHAGWNLLVALAGIFAADLK